MSPDRDPATVSLRELVPEPPDDRFDWQQFERRSRRRTQRRRSVVAAAAVAIATVAVVVPTAVLGHHSGAGGARLLPAASASPTAGPASKGKVTLAPSDPYARRYSDCRASVQGDRLAAPFWLDFDRFEPTGLTPRHTRAEALEAYRTGQATRTFSPAGHEQVFFASYSRYLPATPPTPVWVVVTYHVTSYPSGGVRPPGQASSDPVRPVITDQVVPLSDRTLQPAFILLSMPSRCA